MADQPFDEMAQGCPLNSLATRTWNKKLHKWMEHDGAVPDYDRFYRFLAVRFDRHGTPLNELLGMPCPVSMGWNDWDQSWFRFPWGPWAAVALPIRSQGSWEDGRADWQRAWHACPMEALFSIMYHGKLRASHDKALGDSFWDDAPGVYAFRDDFHAIVIPVIAPVRDR